LGYFRRLVLEALATGHDRNYFEVMDFVDAVQGRKPPPDMTLPGLASQESIRQGA
jgi:hypothetical protein